jgi:hypothetical protein
MRELSFRRVSSPWAGTRRWRAFIALIEYKSRARCPPQVLAIGPSVWGRAQAVRDAYSVRDAYLKRFTIDVCSLSLVLAAAFEMRHKPYCETHRETTQGRAPQLAWTGEGEAHVRACSSRSASLSSLVCSWLVQDAVTK